MGKFRWARFVGALLLGASAADASVTYTFTATSAYGYSGDATGSFIYTSPNFITSKLNLSSSELVSCTKGDFNFCSAEIIVDSSDYGGIGDNYDIIVFQRYFEDPPSGPNYYFEDGAFSHAGSYATVVFGSEQAGTLVVSGTPSLPEPASWATMIIGLCFVGQSMRKKAESRALSLDIGTPRYKNTISNS